MVWRGDDLYKATHSLNNTVLTRTVQCRDFVLSLQDEDYHQEKVNRMGEGCFCTLY